MIKTERFEILRLRAKDIVYETKNTFTLKGLTAAQLQRRKIVVTDSELIRIVQHLDPGRCIPDGSALPYIRGIIELDIGNNTTVYKKNIRSAGGIIVVDGVEYKRIACSAGDSRGRKVFFCACSIWNHVYDILLCGMDPEAEFIPSKTNAYFGMVHSSSVPLTRTPNIIVVDDFHIDVPGIYDICFGDEEKSEYQIERDVYDEASITPADGAGLISIATAKEFAKTLGLSYVPAAFQIRCIPGLKGMLFTFDVADFASEYGCSTITDLWGDTWDVSNGVEVIMTKSQFKFWSQYRHYEEWRTVFDTEIHGYKRTFNISAVSVAPKKLENKKCLAYQHLQTLRLTGREIKELSQPTVDMVTKVHRDIQAFLKYRGVDEFNEDGTKNEDWNRIPPYYRALKHNLALANDPFVRSRMLDDLKSIRNRACVGKLIVSGNYQILAPDLFALAQHAFGLEITGLLGENQIYSQYWTRRKVEKVDILRNPHVGHEHCIANVTTSTDAERWFKYQTSTILTGIRDVIPLRLNGADVDGDTVLTTNNPTIIRAAERSKFNTLISKVSQKQADKCAIANIDGLMAADEKSFQCNIGAVINPISVLWSLLGADEYDEQKIRDYISIMAIVGALTIDAAKTGQIARIPTAINRYLDDKEKPYFMKYRGKTKNRSNDDPDSYIGKQSSTMNLVCEHMERNISKLQLPKAEIEFDYSTLMQSSLLADSDTYKTVKSTLIELQKTYNQLSQFYDKSRNSSWVQKQYDCFFHHCRYSLLHPCTDVNAVIDCLILLYNTDKDIKKSYHNQSILWYAFETEMIQRAKGNFLPGRKVDAEEYRRRKERADRWIEDKRAEEEKFRGELPNEVPLTKNAAKRIIESTSNEKESSLLLLYDVLSRGDGIRKPIIVIPGSKTELTPARASIFSGNDRRSFDKIMDSLKESKGIVVGGNTDEWIVNVNLPIFTADKDEVIATLKNLHDVKEISARYLKPGRK